ncbi:hypothetical protein Caci_5151 [Catenulispora acidiphila DSM 44928]|uniref:Uncharacterized protein n=1 Tax=Catenulispora acidiphila (strain DSM 44928 / JCM 14897 / NBRC 102108 / NRRL B-24433 / ID139908) TaxID=479433 RepID=C7Q6H5_CATAD|nr:hypothetical protein [Catenulispora acidiphila]ACU74010.1 hypothetical protein Caci_5151 [Catenulispora acidiphila DSM 44928]
MSTSSGAASPPSAGGSHAPGTAVHDGKLTIDLRHPPTRADLGYPAGQNFVAYQAGFATANGAPIATTLILPTGTLHIPAYNISADGGNPLINDDPDHRRPPVDLVVTRTFGKLSDAQASVAADAPTLGIPVAPSATYQSGTDYSAVHDWLSVTVTMQAPAADGHVDVQYAFNFGIYHNPARDRIEHDGVVSIDLTRLPTRDDLAMLPTYPSTDLNPEPGKTLSVHLKLPAGTIQRQVTEVTSTSESKTVADPRGIGQPLRTSFTTTATTMDQLKANLLADAAALGLSPQEIQNGFNGNPGQNYGATLQGHSTAVYDVDVSFGGKVGPGNLNSATYNFMYRR